MRKMTFGLIALYAAGMTAVVCARGATDGPEYQGSALLRPSNYREWIFLSSGLGMTYGPLVRAESAPQFFSNVFVNPSAYRSFMKTGRWPDKTVLLLEVRASESEASINKGGRFQTRSAGLEAHVKDSRFGGDGWAFFDLSHGEKAEPLAGKDAAPCVECHTTHAAVDTTFVQFYPTLLDVARVKRTVRAEGK